MANDNSDNGVLVRPLAYVEDHPVIAQLGDRSLYLGNVHAADHTAHDRRFRYVLSATTESQPATTHHRPLLDGEGNDWQAFEAAVETTRELYRDGGDLLVHCKGGISRSATLLATTLAAEEGHSLREALSIVQAARPAAMPNPVLHELAVIYLAAEA